MSTPTEAPALAASPPLGVHPDPIEQWLRWEEQANLPGTFREHPNWRRRLPADVQRLFEDPVARTLLAAVRRERGGGRP